MFALFVSLVLQRPEEGVSPLGLELWMIWVLGIKLGPLEKQPVLLTTKPSLQPSPGHFNKAEDLGLV